MAEHAKTFNVYTSWQGSKLSTRLIGPNGNVITDSQAGNNGGRYEAGKTFQMLEVKDPASGAWNIEVSWADTPPVPEQVNISIAEKSDVFAWMNGFRPRYSVNEPVTINVNRGKCSEQ
ncbi:hypothetical protein [Thiolapillus sp.]|uniref:hypothetical protein n=4 Tax=Thiolapillus sp. TaxID=2017437 RepID=UPI0025F6BF69|nr:hypothetical protein [Thiolapillus sp.]